jgi:hypothetical protein
MLVVRRLPLGRISANASAATLALLIERTMREMHLQAVPFASPAAKHANAIVISGQAEAIARLARLHARGKTSMEWFWTAVIPAWQEGLSRGGRWLALLQAAYDLPEAPLAIAMIVKEAVEAGAENELLCSLPPGRGREWLQVAGWSLAPEADEAASDLALNARHETIVRRWAHRWGPRSRRLSWLAVTLAVAEKPARVADPNLPARVAAWLTQLMARARALPSDGLDQTLAASAPVTAEERRTTADRAPPATNDVVPREPNESLENEVEAITIAAAVELDLQLAKATPAQSSNFAGLFFLIPALQRLGFGEMLAVQPMLIDCDFPVRLLQFIGRRIGLKSNDPLAAVLDEFDPETPLPGSWEMPEAAQSELARPKPRGPFDSPQLVWLTAIRRWCRRHAGMGLISLICRRGGVAVSRTHLDISFPIDAADIRLRRVALDVDPGWVPWLGRVVQFHYCETDE